MIWTSYFISIYTFLLVSVCSIFRWYSSEAVLRNMNPGNLLLVITSEKYLSRCCIQKTNHWKRRKNVAHRMWLNKSNLPEWYKSNQLPLIVWNLKNEMVSIKYIDNMKVFIARTDIYEWSWCWFRYGRNRVGTCELVMFLTKISLFVCFLFHNEFILNETQILWYTRIYLLVVESGQRHRRLT